jgi:glycosyltransferase involved in cell wall biosynthesis
MSHDCAATRARTRDLVQWQELMQRPVPSEPARPPALSVCIPTYQRRERMLSLLGDLMDLGPSVEICIHVDGSTDGTIEALRERAGSLAHIKITDGPNGGRASALSAAIGSATAPFIMLFDDDDDVLVPGLRSLLPLLADIAPDVCGYICHMRTDAGDRLGSAFPCGRSNFMKLRLEQGLRGDKKEVVRSPLLKQAYPAVRGVRRLPTSLLWHRIALTHDVVCLDLEIGVKRYLAGGYSHKIGKIKRSNPGPMRDLHALNLMGFLKGRYRSAPSAARALLAASGYGLLAGLRPSRVGP